MLTPLLVSILCAAPSLTLLDSVKGHAMVELFDDGRWLNLDWRWAEVKTGDAADYVLEVDLYELAGKKPLTLRVPMRPLHARAVDLFVDGTNEHPTRGKAVAPFHIEVVDYRPAANELSLVVKNSRSKKDDSWKRRWLWVVLNAEDGKVVRAHVLHEETGGKGEEHDFKLELRAIVPGGAEAWFSSNLKRAGDKPGFTALTLTISRVDLVTGKTQWSQALELPASNNKNRAGFRFEAAQDFTAMVFAEYSENASEPIEPKPAAYVVWPATGRVQQLEIPYTPYALAFDAKSETLLLGSNQARKLVTYRLSNGKAVSEVGTGEHLHRAYLLPGGTHMLVMYGGATAELRAWPALKPVTKLTAKSLELDGFCPDGARRSPDGRTIAFPRCDARGLTTGDGVVVLGVK